MVGRRDLVSDSTQAAGRYLLRKPSILLWTNLASFRVEVLEDP